MGKLHLRRAALRTESGRHRRHGVFAYGQERELRVAFVVGFAGAFQAGFFVHDFEVGAGDEGPRGIRYPAFQCSRHGLAERDGRQNQEQHQPFAHAADFISYD